MAAKTLTISFMVRISGCSAPSARRVPGRVMSIAFVCARCQFEQVQFTTRLDDGFERVEFLPDLPSRLRRSTLQHLADPCQQPLLAADPTDSYRRSASGGNGQTPRPDRTAPGWTLKKLSQRHQTSSLSVQGFISGRHGFLAQQPDHSATGLERDSEVR